MFQQLLQLQTTMAEQDLRLQEEAKPEKRERKEKERQMEEIILQCDLQQKEHEWKMWELQHQMMIRKEEQDRLWLKQKEEQEGKRKEESRNAR